MFKLVNEIKESNVSSDLRSKSTICVHGLVFPIEKHPESSSLVGKKKFEEVILDWIWLELGLMKAEILAKGDVTMAFGKCYGGMHKIERRIRRIVVVFRVAIQCLTSGRLKLGCWEVQSKYLS